jgi:hypothetical protein
VLIISNSKALWLLDVTSTKHPTNLDYLKLKMNSKRKLEIAGDVSLCTQIICCGFFSLLNRE